MSDSTADHSKTERPSISDLLAKIAASTIALVKAELNAYTNGIKKKLQDLAIAIGLFVLAGLVAIFALSYLVYAVYLAFAIITPPWLASLITAVIMLALAGTCAAIGKTVATKRSMPDAGETAAQLKHNVQGAAQAARDAARAETAKPEES